MRGTVKCGGKPVCGVAVTDGYTFTESDAQGSFTLDADDDALFISLVTPAGYLALEFVCMKKDRLPAVFFAVQRTENKSGPLLIHDALCQ